MWHTADIDQYFLLEPDLSKFPVEGQEGVPCWFSKKDWQHVRFEAIPMSSYVTVENVIYSIATLAAFAGLIFTLRTHDSKSNKNE